jgi:hypothetical protein
MRLVAWPIFALAVIAGAACGRGEAAPPCVIGKPCEFEPGQGTTYDGLPCVGEQAYDNGRPFCSCSCFAPSDAGGDDVRADAEDASDAGGGADGAVCSTGTPGACNMVQNIGTVVSASCVQGAPPALMGGTVVDGTYVLVAATAYTPDCADASIPTGGPTTIVLTSGCLQSIDVRGGAQTYTWTAQGTTMTWTRVCPGSFVASLPYTATATTLSTLGPLSPGIDVISVFQRQ